MEQLSYYLIINLVLLSWLVVSPCTQGRNRTNNDMDIQCIHTESDALLQFKHGITKDDAGMFASWRPQTDCCKWHGVVCSNITDHVVSLKLGAGDNAGMVVEGKVSPSLAELKYLLHLNLSFLSFYGDIPYELGNLSNLKTLDLQSSFGYVNQSLSWVSRLSRLRYLDLSGAILSKFTNWMSIVSTLPSLRVLRMDFCRLPPKIPSSLSYVNSSTTLHTIGLQGNELDNSVLQWLLNFPRITTQLEYLDLSQNSLQGSNALKITSKLCNLKHLDLGVNNFTDELHDVIQSLVKCNNQTLSTLDLSYNRFWGTIPNSITYLSSLTEFYLTKNQLKGEISLGIGKLVLLEKLDLSYNYFEDTLTHTVFLNHSNLRELSLSGNPGLVLNMNEDWIPPFNLDIIALRSCKLGPRFPKWLQLQTNFSVFDVSNTSIFDNIPVSFWKALSSNLMYLNMSYNQFYGKLPNLSHMSKALAIDLSSNLFEGVVPSELANSAFLYLNDNKLDDCSSLCPKTTSYLEILNLSNNLFSGEISDCWRNFSKLTSLHLENNKFSGHIRHFMPNLKYVHLYNNNFSGPFPVVFEKCTSLTILNLGHNLFTGHIPSWIGNTSHVLGVIILRKNHFIGEIPVSVCQLNHLQILDIAINHISGVIPNCIYNFTWMEGVKDFSLEFDSVNLGLDGYGETITQTETAVVSWKREEQIFKETVQWVKLLDLSSNELSGEIPEGISKLNGLQSINLSRNQLIGRIPSEIGNLTALELLDLSNNHLTGQIPISLAKVTTLGTLNVSNNNLSGEIPVSTQLSTFDASSYAGNPSLCGTPLPSCSKDRESSNELKGDNPTTVQDKNDDFGFFLGLFISVALGFVVGFWGVCGTLIIKTSWRHAYFQFIDNIIDKVF